MSLEDIIKLSELSNYNLDRNKTGESILYKLIEKLNPVAAKLDSETQAKYENVLGMADSKILNGNHQHLEDAVSHYYMCKEEVVKQRNSGRTM